MDRGTEIRAMVSDLTDRYPVLPGPTVHRLVGRLFAEYDDAPVQTYVPVLVRRAAEQALRELRELDAARAGEPTVPAPRARQTA